MLQSFIVSLHITHQVMHDQYSDKVSIVSTQQIKQYKVHNIMFKYSMYNTMLKALGEF